MTTYAIFTVPGHGHVNPTLALAQELIARGERVIYYQTEEYRSTIEASGAVFSPYESGAWKKYLPTMSATLTGKPDLAQRITLMATLALESVKEMPALLEQMVTDQIDCILYDRLFIQGALASRALHLPAVHLSPSFVVNQQAFQHVATQITEDNRPGPSWWATLNEEMALECETYKLPRITFQELMANVENLSIIFIPRTFQPAGETFDERYVFVGPSLPAQRHASSNLSLEWLEKEQRPLLYISLGTAFNQRVDFYRMCFEAFAQSKWQVILSFGTKIDPAELKEAPANFLLAPQVPQLEVLTHADLFISHGGMNSTMESLWFGVPLVVVPQMIEQEINARQVQTLGLGLALEKETLTAEKLRDAVEQVAQDASIQPRMQKMQQEMRQAGGAQRAAEEIMRYIGSASQKDKR